MNEIMLEDYQKKKRLKEYYWKIVEENMPGIKNIFESCAIGLRLMNLNESYINITHTNISIKCHIHLSTSKKIFSLYYYLSDNKVFIRNILNENNKLKTSSPKIEIQSIDELQQYLNELLFKVYK